MNQIDTDVLSVLSRCETTGNRLTLVGQLERKLYERTNKVLEAAGGKWDRKAKAHLFAGDAADCMEQVMLTGEVDYGKSPKSIAQQYGQFDTPQEVVYLVMQRADIKRRMEVLEPSMGKGALARAALALGARVSAMEIDASRVPQDLRDMGFCRIDDFLEIPAPGFGWADRVVMNPPFAKQADIRHVMHAHQFLRPGGRLVSVMSAGVTFREDALTRRFRNLVDKYEGVIEPVPAGAFKASGTGVNTVIVTMDGPKS